MGRAIAISGNNAAFHNNLGEAYRALQRFPEAAACYRRAIALQPQLAEAHNNLGIALKAVGNLEEAVTCYRRALQSKPNYVTALINLGNVLQVQGALDEAVGCYRQALDLQPDCAKAHNSLGAAFGRKESWTRQSLPSAALASKPNYSAAYYNLGAASKRARESGRSHRLLPSGDPTGSRTRLCGTMIWVSYYRTKEFDEAVACYCRACN